MQIVTRVKLTTFVALLKNHTISKKHHCWDLSMSRIVTQKKFYWVWIGKKKWSKWDYLCVYRQQDLILLRTWLKKNDLKKAKRRWHVESIAKSVDLLQKSDDETRVPYPQSYVRLTIRYNELVPHLVSQSFNANLLIYNINWTTSTGKTVSSVMKEFTFSVCPIS